MPPRDSSNPVLQRYQVEIRGNFSYVTDTKRHTLVGGPYKSRIRAKARADQCEGPIRDG
jgi:hypothetical protein